mmetsp:Transcript_35625/g.54479  ORF Transcript_35625/g.54479 Transcript_35625/m.54479 type:complete len:125 (+) Transcript_35625:2378-2752(+)
MPGDERQALAEKRTKDYFQDHPAVYPEINEGDMGLDEASISITVKTREATGLDIIDATQYSIQQSKLRTEEDHRMTLAERKKQGVRKQIEDLRQEFMNSVKKNNMNKDHLRISEDDFQIDMEYF